LIIELQNTGLYLRIPNRGIAKGIPKKPPIVLKPE
jgi:hypothetical protein